jgi:hypothetical protein
MHDPGAQPQTQTQQNDPQRKENILPEHPGWPEQHRKLSVAQSRQQAVKNSQIMIAVTLASLLIIFINLNMMCF